MDRPVKPGDDNRVSIALGDACAMTGRPKDKSPARRGRPDGAFGVRKAPLRAPGQLVQAVEPLIDQLNDAAGVRIDQHGLSVHHGVAMGRLGDALRHVVIGNAGVRQHGADHDPIRDREFRNLLTNDIFAERRPLSGADAIRFGDDDGVAARGARGGFALRLRRDRCADGADDGRNGEYPVPHEQLLRVMHAGFAARNPYPIHRARHRSCKRRVKRGFPLQFFAVFGGLRTQ